MSWRPKDWIYISGYSDCSSIRESGADDMLSALIKWLDEPCDCTYFVGDKYIKYAHRYLCPHCMAELRGEK